MEQNSEIPDEAQAKRKTVVFDFDKTLFNGDSGYLFYRYLICASKRKIVLFFLLFPLLLILFAFRKTRLMSLHLVCWLATLGVTGKDLKERLSEYYQQLSEKQDVLIYESALEEIVKRQREGYRIVIITGAPSWLARYIARQCRIPFDRIIGSRLTHAFYGLFTSEYCFGKNKLTMATQKKECFEQWVHGYTDSLADMPVMDKCTESITLINPSEKLKGRAEQLAGEKVRVVEWV